ncbi:hypothetical protein ACFE04_029556 [Oxalis oulophora]
MACLLLGNTEKYGLKRPSTSPLELKSTKVPGIKKISRDGQIELVNGDKLEVDSVILATGYKSNVPSWLKKGDFFSKNRFPRGDGWKGNAGIYAVGLQGEDYLVHRLTLLKSQKILGKFGNKKLSNKRKGPQFVIEGVTEARGPFQCPRMLDCNSVCSGMPNCCVNGKCICEKCPSFSAPSNCEK